mgnify:CR=1 FL=1
MFANFTQETCTGTGDTLALAGFTTDSIPFSASFADGDLVAYVVKDSGGSIKVSGIGTYVAATDDITRNDNWNYSGTVVDKSPATNITLSAGTHTISCDVVASTLRATHKTYASKTVAGFSSSGLTTFTGFSANNLYATPFEIISPVTVTDLLFKIVTAVAASQTRVGIYSMGLDGKPALLLVDSGDQDTSVTGVISASVSSTDLQPGFYFAVMLSDSNIDPTGITRGNSAVRSVGTSAGFTIGYDYCELTASVTYAALPAIAPAMTLTTAHQPPAILLGVA